MILEISILFLGVGEDCGGLDVYAEFLGFGEDGSCQFWLQVFRTIAEVGFGCPYVGCVGHRVFTSFRKPVYAVGEFPSFFFI